MANALTHKDQYELLKWFDENRQKAAETSIEDLSEELTELLPFTVTTGNVKGALATLGIQKRYPKRGSAETQRIEALETRVEFLEGEVKGLLNLTDNMTTRLTLLERLANR